MPMRRGKDWASDNSPFPLPRPYAGTGPLFIHFKPQSVLPSITIYDANRVCSPSIYTHFSPPNLLFFIAVISFLCYNRLQNSRR